MKILITTDLFSTPTNGVVTSINNLRRELTKKGHEVRVLTLSGSLHSYRDGPVSYVKSISLGFIYPAVRMPVSYRDPLIQEILDWKPDLVHSQCEFFSLQFALRISKTLQIPLVHTYHTLYEQYVSYLFPSERLGRFVVRFLSRTRLKRAAQVIAPTKKVENALRSYGLQNPIRVIPSGISLEPYQNPMPEAERLRRRRALGIPDDHQVLLNLGRLGVEKNLEELLRLFAQELTRREKLTFLIVGGGPDKAQLETLSQELRIADHVIFTGMVRPAEAPEYYQLGDVFVCASTSETQGLTYMEAAASGLRLLCRKDPCLDGVIEAGVNGYEYTAPEEFQDRLNAMLDDTDWRKRAGQHSREMAASYDPGRFADAMETVYKAVLSNHPSYSAVPH